MSHEQSIEWFNPGYIWTPVTGMTKLGERIVWAVPPLGNVAATFYGWKLHRYRYGRLYHQTVSEILNRNTWSKEQILEYQNKQLHHLIRHAVKHVPYYRERFSQLGLSPEDIKTVSELQ